MAKEDISVDMQTVLFHGNRLEDVFDFEYYEIKPESTLKLVVGEKKNQASMKWGQFVKVSTLWRSSLLMIDRVLTSFLTEKAMNLLGFKEVNSSQSSRFTFYPPNPDEKPFVIHRRECTTPDQYLIFKFFQHSTAHPDPTIYPVLLNKVVKKLKESYDWVPTHFGLNENTHTAFEKIHLLSPTPLEVRVSLSLISTWSFSVIYPCAQINSEENEGEGISWDVSVHSDGTMKDKSTGAKLPYFFWGAR